jgi:type I restriction enzyme, S subunit
MSKLVTQNIGSAIAITKGRKHTVINSITSNSNRLIGIDDLRNDNILRYTDDLTGVSASSDDVLIAWDGANAGTIGFGKVGYIGSTIARLRIKDKASLHAPFLGFYLRSKFDYLRQTSTGATIPHVNRKALENIPVPALNFADQIQIARLLGKVDNLVAQRKQQLLQLDQLLKSVFLKMFGPQSPGYDEWPMVEILELAAKHKGAMRTGPFGSNLLHSEFTAEGDVAVLGIDNAVQNTFEWVERRFISSQKYQELANYRIYPDDVIVTIMGTIGRSAVIPLDIPLAINTKHLAAITLNREIANPLFLSYSIHSSPFILNQFRSKNRGAIMNGLNLGLIKETKLKRPPIERQNKFAEIHTRVDDLKAMFQTSLTDLEALYDVLSQQAFTGELDLSRVSLPEAPPPAEEPAVSNHEALHATAPQGIDLPDTDLLLAALKNRERVKDLLEFWLSAYRSQLGHTPFSAQSFIAAAQTRVAELLPDDDFELRASDYDYIKTWVFEALSLAQLTQVFDADSNRVQLKAGQV